MSRAREIASRNAGTIGGSSIVNTSGAITTTGALAGATLTTTGNIVMGDDTSIGIADDAERIEFDGAGDISVLGANLGVGTDAPTATTSSYKVYSGTANTVDGMTLAVASDGAVNTRSEIGFGKQVAGSYSPSSISYVTDDATSFSKGHFEFALRDATTDSAATMHLQIDSDGDVTVNTGDLVIGAVGKGIDFSNAADTAAGETIGTRGSVLDDYEEGTFTATLSNYAGGNPSTTQNIPGYYVKIGNLVQIDISGWSLDAGGASGQVVVAGIPFTSSNPGSNRAFHGQCGLMRNICTIPTGTTLITDPMPRLAKNSAIVFIYANRVDSSNYAAVNYKGGTMSNGVLEFSIAYEAL